jgi:hypothetical protein
LCWRPDPQLTETTRSRRAPRSQSELQRRQTRTRGNGCLTDSPVARRTRSQQRQTQCLPVHFSLPISATRLNLVADSNDELERRAVSEQPETTTRQVLFGLSSEPVPLARSKRWLEGTPTSTTVRGRRFGGKRSQMRLALSAPRRQPKRAWGSIAPPHQPNVLGARPAPNRSRCQPHAHSEAPNEDACRTIKSATINAIAELKRSGPSHLFATLKRPK